MMNTLFRSIFSRIFTARGASVAIVLLFIAAIAFAVSGFYITAGVTAWLGLSGFILLFVHCASVLSRPLEAYEADMIRTQAD